MKRARAVSLPAYERQKVFVRPDGGPDAQPAAARDDLNGRQRKQAAGAGCDDALPAKHAAGDGLVLPAVCDTGSGVKRLRPARRDVNCLSDAAAAWPAGGAHRAEADTPVGRVINGRVVPGVPTGGP